MEQKRDVIARDIDTSTAEGSEKIEQKVDHLKDRVDQLSKQL